MQDLQRRSTPTDVSSKAQSLRAHLKARQAWQLSVVPGLKKQRRERARSSPLLALIHTLEGVNDEAQDCVWNTVATWCKVVSPPLRAQSRKDTYYFMVPKPVSYWSHT